MILAGDIGGTNSRLASFEVVQGRVKPIVEETFPSRGSASLDDIVRTFVSKHNLRITHACFGIAGPIGTVAVRPLIWRGWWMASALPKNWG